ncbi:hypothetical protein CDL15_Pgr028413 [Punica granatum]|uniref:Uncharacterized protein n=1 Tax=Punica granatum TaxID=22663 RepID=A0A218W5I5_PUNGR|nr:hypothetical protein CDL15_Pgr028413 [Punica granatum]
MGFSGRGKRLQGCARGESYNGAVDWSATRRLHIGGFVEKPAGCAVDRSPMRRLQWSSRLCMKQKLYTQTTGVEYKKIPQKFEIKNKLTSMLSTFKTNHLECVDFVLASCRV